MLGNIKYYITGYQRKTNKKTVPFSVRNNTKQTIKNPKKLRCDATVLSSSKKETKRTFTDHRQLTDQI